MCVSWRSASLVTRSGACSACLRYVERPAVATAAVGSTYSPCRASLLRASAMSASVTVIIVPCVSRTAARICRLRAGAAIAIPSATVPLFVSGCATSRSPLSQRCESSANLTTGCARIGGAPATMSTSSTGYQRPHPKIIAWCCPFLRRIPTTRPIGQLTLVLPTKA